MSKQQGKIDYDLLAFWKEMRFPVRPSKQLVSQYAKTITELGLNQKGCWGLLGCTPELRSLAAECKRPLTCIDKNEYAFDTFHELCTLHPEETFVNIDWLDADLPESFDLILGDGSLIMLPEDRHVGFFENIHKMLKPGGHALLKIFSFDSSPYDTPEAIIDWYRSTCADTHPIRELRTHLGLLWLDQETMTIRKDDYARNLDDLYRNKVLLEDEYQGLLACKMNVDLHCTRRDQLEAMMQRHFEILSRNCASGTLDEPYYPLYALRKR